MDINKVNNTLQLEVLNQTSIFLRKLLIYLKFLVVFSYSSLNKSDFRSLQVCEYTVWNMKYIKY